MPFIKTRAHLSVTAFFACFSAFWSVISAQNVTIDDLDTSVVLSPLELWAWSKEGSGENNGTFSFSNDVSATVTFTFPSESHFGGVGSCTKISKP